MATAAPRATLPRSERLRGKSAFERLMAEGRGMTETPFRLIGILRPMTEPSPCVRIAFAVPKRHLPRAVDRNRARRLMREGWRRDKSPWIERIATNGVRCDWLLVFQSTRILPLDATRHKMARLFQRWLNELPS
jgi:ribonuclease P protein component